MYNYLPQKHWSGVKAGRAELYTNISADLQDWLLCPPCWPAFFHCFWMLPCLLLTTHCLFSCTWIVNSLGQALSFCLYTLTSTIRSWSMTWSPRHCNNRNSRALLLLSLKVNVACRSPPLLVEHWCFVPCLIKLLWHASSPVQKDLTSTSRQKCV